MQKRGFITKVCENPTLSQKWQYETKTVECEFN